MLARVIAPFTALVGSQAQVFPLGFLMGLGFDTASEVALLALTGQAGAQGLGWASILALPVLFAAGMTLFDTLNGVAMAHAYRWALIKPQVKRNYNLLVTGLSGLIALVIGNVTLLQWAGEHFPHLLPSEIEAWDLSSLWLSGLILLVFGGALWQARRR